MQFKSFSGTGFHAFSQNNGDMLISFCGMTLMTCRVSLMGPPRLDHNPLLFKADPAPWSQHPHLSQDVQICSWKLCRVSGSLQVPSLKTKMTRPVQSQTMRFVP